jgi:RNA polymerase sigma factor (sigma-70 family)
MPLSSLTTAGVSATEFQEIAKAADLPAHEAFAIVVKRHSAMVLGVCRRMLGNADAEDAAQAVFVLFWQKAMHMQDESRIAGWLHRTAQHVSRNVKRSRVSRIIHEQQAAAVSPAMSPDATDTAQWKEIRVILDEEVNRLPEKLRTAFVLFHCENRSLAEVAELIGATVPTVGTWLQRSRKKLADRLSRRGIAIGATTLGAVLSQHVVAEAVPAAFIAGTVQTVSDVSAVGLTACTPSVAAMVKAGALEGLSKTFWIALSLVAAGVSFPLVVFWMLPALQTRQSPDFRLLQGEWREVAHEQNGGPVNAVPSIEYVGTLQIVDWSFHRFQTLADGRVLEGGSGSFVVDSSQSPAAIDFNQRQGTAYGIYELGDDTLTVCVTRGGGPRPDGLSTAQNDDRVLLRYQRVR